MRSLASFIAGAALLGACPSTSVYRSATPVSEGHWRASAASSLGAMNDREQGSAFPTADLELAVRRGMSANSDLGAKLHSSGVELNGTWRLRDAGGEEGGWSFALAPALGGVRVQESALSPDAIDLFAQLHGVASKELSKRWTLSMGPSTGLGVYWPVTGGSERGLWLGAFGNGEFRLSSRWHMIPEFGFYRVVAGQVPVRGGAMRMGLAFSREL